MKGLCLDCRHYRSVKYRLVPEGRIFERRLCPFLSSGELGSISSSTIVIRCDGFERKERKKS